MSRRHQRRRRLPKKLISFAVMFVLAAVVLVKVTDNNRAPDSNSVNTVTYVTSSPQESATPTPAAEVVWTYPEGYVDLSELPDVDLSSWEFTLVNALDSANYVRESFVPNLASVESGFQVRTGVDEPLKAFMAAARAEGFTISISRAYMSYYEISYKFNGVASGIADGKGVSYSEAVQQAYKIAHYPGTDEHQLGVAVNFVDGEGNWQLSSPAISWMGKHCAEYGFILRYPMGREEYTGWEFTPNQFRYVGVDAATYIMDKGISLEEFLNAYAGAKR